MCKCTNKGYLICDVYYKLYLILLFKCPDEGLMWNWKCFTFNYILFIFIFPYIYIYIVQLTKSVYKCYLHTIYLQTIYDMYKEDLSLNNLKWLIYLKTKPNQTKSNQLIYIYIYIYFFKKKTKPVTWGL